MAQYISNGEKHPRVFISYSHDSREHANKILALADKLRSDGIDAILDQYEPWPTVGWVAWMTQQVRKADFVLMICTEMYYKGLMKDVKSNQKLGIKWEWNLISNYFYEAGAVNKRFFPVLFDQNDSKWIPDPFKGMPWFCVKTQEGYEELYRRLTNRPKTVKPKLGRIRVLLGLRDRERKTDFFIAKPEIYCSERFNKTRRFAKLAGILGKRDQISDLCSKNKKVDVCQLHEDTIGIGQDVRQYDSRTARILYVVDLMEEMMPFIRDVGKENIWREPMGDLEQEITRFFNEVENNIFEKKNRGTVNVIRKIKAILKAMVEDPSVKREVDSFVDSLVRYRKQYTSTNMFLQNRSTTQKKDRELLSDLAGMPGHIKRLRCEMLKNTRADCEISAGWIDQTIKKDPRIKQHDTAAFKIVATTPKSRTVLTNIGAIGAL